MKKKWKIFIFEDGTELHCRGMSKQEIQQEERQHGKLLSVEVEEYEIV